jgi:hypothetical protein
MLDQRRRRERAGGDETSVAERDLAGQAGEKIQRERADGGQRGLRDEIEDEGDARRGSTSSARISRPSAARRRRVSTRARSLAYVVLK